MKKLLLILLCLPFIGFGQSFIKTFGDNNLLLDCGHSVQQTTDGGYIVTGYTEDVNWYGLPTINNVFLIKTDGSGIEQWNKIFGENTYNTAYSVQQTTDGGYIIAGSTGNEWYDRDVYLIKTDGNGDSLWTKTFNSSNLSDSITVYNVAYSVQQTTDGGYIITGLCNPDVQSGETYFSFLLKVDGNGVEQWNQKLSDTYIAKSVKQTTDGGYIIAVSNGAAFIEFPHDEGILIKTDAQGNEQWKKIFPQYVDGCVFYSADQTADGGYIISGETDSIINGIQMDNWLIKTDAQGNEQWSQLFEGHGGKDAHQTTDGGYIILGGSNWISQSQSDIKIIKTNGFGAEQWSKTFGTTQGDKGDVGLSVQQTTDGGYIITGYFDIVIPQLDYVMCLIKTDDNGNVTSTFNIPINPERKLEKTVDLLGKETKPKTNIPFIEIYDDGTVEKRIVIE